MAKSITVIPATRNLHTGVPTNSARKRRVAGYARVSTDSEEQSTSYEAQVDYYTNYIKGLPALSRMDNETLICPDSGTQEALETMGVGEE